MTPFRPIRTVLRGAALFAAAFALSFWAVRGAHPGWSQDRRPVERTDAVTGLTYTEYIDRFTPGVDFLVLGLGAGFLLLALSVIPLPSSRQKQPTAQTS